MRGEFELIAAIGERLVAAGAPMQSPGLLLGSGDDAAITAHPGVVVTSVDALVEGVGFRVPPFDLRSVGHKALASALSDLAAMGADAGEAYVQLGVPEGLEDERLLELADGLGALAGEHGVAVAGGDLTRARDLFVAVTAVGHAPGEQSLVRRAGATPGDLLVVSGELGGAAAGLTLLERPELDRGIEPAVAAALRRRQLEPTPRLAAGRGLARAGAGAMIDLSDGLGGDAGHVATASGTRLRIELDSLPVAPGVAEVARAAGVELLDLVTAGGEDYELLAALPAERLAGARDAAAAVPLTVVGAVESGAGVVLSGPGGSTRQPRGFDQRRSPRARA